MTRIRLDHAEESLLAKEEPSENAQLLQAFARYVTDPTERNFQGILSLLEDGGFKKIKSSWRDSAELQGNLRKLIDNNRETWVDFWQAVVMRLSIANGSYHKFLWKLSPFGSEEALVRLRMNETGNVEVSASMLAPVLSRQLRKRGRQPNERSEFLMIIAPKAVECFVVRSS